VKLIIATKNDSKIAEIKQILDLGIEFKTYKDFSDWPDVAETGATFKENALIKAKALAEKYKISVVADDSGLVVEALGGAPGVLSSRYAGEDANDAQNLAKLLSEMAGIKDREAAFQTVVAFYDQKGAVIFADGKVSGTIIDEPRGSGGFGYDPVFVPDGYDKTFAEMSAEEKNKLSHRGQAFRKLMQILVEKVVT